MNDDARNDSLIEDAIEILIERCAPGPEVSLRRLRSELHDRHDVRAFRLLAEDSGTPFTAKVLADLLVPPPPPNVPPRVESATADAGVPRRQWDTPPMGWINPDAHARCIATARAALLSEAHR